jgi:RimJ/RimL family protein N-acetyltransferase
MMFARTERLILRPAWPEDAPRLAGALNQIDVSRNLFQVPQPYSVADAAAWIDRPREPRLPELLVLLRTRGTPRLVGGCGIVRAHDGALELGYWIDRPHWGLGFATEAARALMRMVRATGLGRVRAGQFLDNPASGRVLRKLGFQPTGRIENRLCRARNDVVATAVYEDNAADCADNDNLAMKIYRDSMLVPA